VNAAEAIWLTDLPKAEAQAKAENKIVLLDFTGSDWCGWCIKFKKEVLDTPEFQGYADKNVVLVKLDYPNKIAQTAELKAANAVLKDTQSTASRRSSGWTRTARKSAGRSAISKAGHKASSPSWKDSRRPNNFAPENLFPGGLVQPTVPFLINAEMFNHRGGTILENLFHVSVDEEIIHQCAAGHGVYHAVAAERAAVFFRERVRVAPAAIWSAPLLVAEADRRIPAGDFRAPAHRQAVNFQPVINHRPDAHLDIAGREDIEIQPRRRDDLQIARIGEKRENPFARHRQPEFGFKNMRPHRLAI
jgi:thiol-disulfide isomerase/thioredoxin